MKLTLETMPLSTNAMYRGGRRYLTDAAKANKESLGWEAKQQWRKKPLKCPVELVIDIWWPNERRHDVDNIKGLLDAFTGILYDDDSQIWSLQIRKWVDKNRPRVEIIVYPSPT